MMYRMSPTGLWQTTQPSVHHSHEHHQEPRSPSLSLLIIVFLWLVVYATGMFTPALLDDADSVHAEAAREMLQRHDWVTLYTDGIRYLEKAPLMYWGIAASYKVFGVSDWSTRMPTMLGVLAMLLATYGLGRRTYGETGGLWSAIVLGTSVGPYIYTRFQIPDVMVGLWLTTGFYFFLRSLEQEQPSRWVCWGFAASCALNVLTKSLIGVVFPLGVIGIYLLLTGNLRHLLKMRPVSSTLVFLSLAAPWHILAAFRNPSQGAVKGFLWFYFINEQFLRYLNKRVPPGYDTVPLLIFWALTLVWLVPWIFFLPQALADVPRRLRDWRSKLDARQRANLLCALWVMAIVVFFSFSTRQEYYTIPVVPGMALLVGGWLSKEAESGDGSRERQAARTGSAVFLAVAALAFIAGIALLSLSRTPPPGTDLADLLKKNPADYNLSLGHFLDLTPAALGLFRGPLLGTVLCLLVGAGLNLSVRKRNRPMQGNVALALMMIGLLACVRSGFVRFSPVLSSKKLALAIARHYKPGDIVIVDGEYHQASTLNFYTGVPLHVLHPPSGNLWYGSKFPDAPNVFETPASLDGLWSSPGTVFLWSDHEDPAELRGKQKYVLAYSGGKYIFTNWQVGANSRSW
jgi:4-amino-4-deoxy-L-arabinose transferase-like glycosyltransferase